MTIEKLDTELDEFQLHTASLVALRSEDKEETVPSTV
jgi:deoxycytidylate deaminase